jgi:hypothetical protein
MVMDRLKLETKTDKQRRKCAANEIRRELELEQQLHLAQISNLRI